MKKVVFLFILCALSAATAVWITAALLHNQFAAESAARQASWDAEKAQLQAALEDAQHRPHSGFAAPARSISDSVSIVAETTPTTPAELIAKLKSLPLGGATKAVLIRKAMHLLEQLVEGGPSSVGAITNALAEKVDFEIAGVPKSGGPKGSIPVDFIIPPSLRIGLLDALRRIGEPQSEQALFQQITKTESGAELLWITRALQQMSFGVAEVDSQTTAKALLDRSLAQPLTPQNAIDRENLYAVLSIFGDASYVQSAEAQLIQPDGKLDNSSLKYLMNTLGKDSVPIAAQLYDDPRLNNASSREMLARVALNFAGTDPLATEFYKKSITDPLLTADHRRNLIEDLNQDGFANRKNLTAQDLPLIDSRLALINQLAPQNTDQVNGLAFQEAYKDLVKMREKAVAEAAKSYVMPR